MPLKLRGHLRTPPIYHVTFNQKYPLQPQYNLGEVSSGKATADSSFRVEKHGTLGAVSVWKTPKRTRTYPYSRMYFTLNRSGCRPITVIPVVKDEGAGKGRDRDYLQWDSLSMTSYLGIYAILAYYVAARKDTKEPRKVTGFVFDWDYVGDKISEALETHMTPKEWNDRERTNLGRIVGRVLEGQDKIREMTGVSLKSREFLVRKLRKLGDPESFMRSSRLLSRQAQERESETQQPKELIYGVLKASITLNDSWGGVYNWTVDEAQLVRDKVLLIDKKHGKIIPHYDDLSDAFFKMIFWTNIEELSTVDGIPLQPIPVVAMTSKTGEGSCFNKCPVFSHCDLIHCTYHPLLRYNAVEKPVQSDGDARDAFLEGLQNNFMVYIFGSNAVSAERTIVAEHLLK